jgi:hypothetical protein
VKSGFLLPDQGKKRLKMRGNSAEYLKNMAQPRQPHEAGAAAGIIVCPLSCYVFPILSRIPAVSADALYKFAGCARALAATLAVESWVTAYRVWRPAVEAWLSEVDVWPPVVLA